MNRDFRDLLAEFNAQGVEYLVVGAHALAAHGHVRKGSGPKGVRSGIISGRVGHVFQGRFKALLVEARATGGERWRQVLEA